MDTEEKYKQLKQALANTPVAAAEQTNACQPKQYQSANGVQAWSFDDIQALYEQRYIHEEFVDVLPQGSHPDTRNVRGSNNCQISIFQPQGQQTIVVLSVIDNLVKGAAGQAIQNMNLMFGFKEELGLKIIALYP